MNNARKCPQCQQHLAIDSFHFRGRTGFRFKKCDECMTANCKYKCHKDNCDFATNNMKDADMHIYHENIRDNIMEGRPSGYGMHP